MYMGMAPSVVAVMIAPADVILASRFAVVPVVVALGGVAEEPWPNARPGNMSSKISFFIVASF
jgi:hypothetical protein